MEGMEEGVSAVHILLPYSHFSFFFFLILSFSTLSTHFNIRFVFRSYLRMQKVSPYSYSTHGPPGAPAVLEARGPGNHASSSNPSSLPLHPLPGLLPLCPLSHCPLLPSPLSPPAVWLVTPAVSLLHCHTSLLTMQYKPYVSAAKYSVFCGNIDCRILKPLMPQSHNEHAITYAVGFIQSTSVCLIIYLPDNACIHLVVHPSPPFMKRTRHTS